MDLSDGDTSNGTRIEIWDCEQHSPTPVPAYTCVAEDYQCIEAPGGKYLTKGGCTEACVKPKLTGVAGYVTIFGTNSLQACYNPMCDLRGSRLAAPEPAGPAPWHGPSRRCRPELPS